MPLQQSTEKFFISLGTKTPFFTAFLASSIALSLLTEKGIMNSGLFCLDILLNTTFGLPQ